MTPCATCGGVHPAIVDPCEVARLVARVDELERRVMPREAPTVPRGRPTPSPFAAVRDILDEASGPGVAKARP